MKIRLVSDIHVEFGDYTMTPMPDDAETTLVLAGDLGERTLPEPFVRRCCDTFANVIYVHGNHEYYRGEIREVTQAWKDIAATLPNLHFLDNETVVIDDVRFIGTVLWTDFGGNWFSLQASQRGMNDFYVVDYQPNPDDPYRRKFTAQDSIDLHKINVEFLESELATEFDGRTFVVTHHSPSMSLVGDEFAGSSINAAFHSNCDYMFEKYDIDVWCYGHTHRPCARKFAETWVFSNQRGYAGTYDSIKAEFDHEWILDTNEFFEDDIEITATAP